MIIFIPPKYIGYNLCHELPSGVIFYHSFYLFFLRVTNGYQLDGTAVFMNVTDKIVPSGSE
jgi:hypothetical protein